MFDIVLHCPDIAVNTGNIIRLCANTGCKLHLIRPLGFVLDDKRLKRAGLDYITKVTITVYNNFSSFLKSMVSQRRFAVETSGNQLYSKVAFKKGDVMIFGSETRGLATDILATFNKENIINIPMRSNNRSLNLANAVAIVVYEAWRQQQFS